MRGKSSPGSASLCPFRRVIRNRAGRRCRAGPGFQVGGRASDPADIGMGSCASRSAQGWRAGGYAPAAAGGTSPCGSAQCNVWVDSDPVFGARCADSTGVAGSRIHAASGCASRVACRAAICSAAGRAPGRDRMARCVVDRAAVGVSGCGGAFFCQSHGTAALVQPATALVQIGRPAVNGRTDGGRCCAPLVERSVLPGCCSRASVHRPSIRRINVGRLNT
jgi:hypothetical protein